MKLTMDTSADALYLALADGSPVAGTRQVAPGIMVDYTADGRVIGIELLSVSKRAAEADLSRVLFETTGGATRVAESSSDYNPQAD